MKVRNIKRAAILLAGCIVLGILVVFAVDYHVKSFAKPYIKSINELPSSEAILVLGALVHPNGDVSGILHDRLETAKEVYDTNTSLKVIVSGDHGTKEYDEVHAMKQYLMDKSLKSESIFMDHAGFNTYESMFRAKEIFQANRLIIVTQEYHLSRAIYIARKMGIDAYGVPADKMAYRAIKKYEAREILARNKDFVNVNFTKPNPTYLGEVIPISSDGNLTNDSKPFE